ncbi:MAG: class I adenylate-forming enzyme family protein [Peptoniphilus sp.]|nr:class I adenylate-forming enzyme family protein [Peptoniphilus sp.]MDY3118076.1 class I adenylate-forming enzyme family protein [Peptoniphilus sp.]
MDYNKTLGCLPFLWNKNHPDRVAILHKEREYTYGDLYDISLSFASYFATSGVKRGDHVLIMGKNSADWLFTFFGLQMLGAVTVPVNPSFTTNEIAQIMDIVGAKIVVTNEFHDYAQQIKDIYKIDKDFRVLYTNRGYQYPHLLHLKVAEDPSAIAVILLTSGTTGVPKGVQLTHKNLISNASTVAKIVGWNETDRFLLCVPLFHCFGLSATALCAFLCGSSLVVLDNTKSYNQLAAIGRYKITVFNGVPTLFIVAMRHNDLDAFDLSSLKTGIIAGAPLTAREYEEIQSAFGFQRLIQSYGQTETSPAITVVRPWEPPSICATSVGTAIDDVEIAVVDDDLRPVDANRPGNIVVRGANVMVGYINGKHRYTEKDWLCTGDVGYMDEAGHLYISGRTKDIIIRGGENISAIEIENVVKELDFIDQARVLAVKDPFMGEEAALHVSLCEAMDKKKAEEMIRRYIQHRLVKYKIPKYIAIHDSLPTNGTGKIDDKALMAYMKDRARVLCK